MTRGNGVSYCALRRGHGDSFDKITQHLERYIRWSDRSDRPFCPLSSTIPYSLREYLPCDRCSCPCSLGGSALGASKADRSSCACCLKHNLSGDQKHRRITLCRTLGSSTAKHLIAVVLAGEVRETKRLLRAGAWVNGDETLGCPPIACAAHAGQATVAKVLLKAGADIDIAVPRYVYHTPPPDNFFTLGEGQHALHAAVARLRSETVRLLLDSGADVNAVDVEGSTPLFVLCQTHPKDDDPEDSKRVAIAQQLFQGGAGITAPDNKGYYPVHYAAQFENTGLLDAILLWESPPDLDRRSEEDGKTPLCIAAMVGQASTVAHLLSRGAQQPAAYELECARGLSTRASVPAYESSVSRGYFFCCCVNLDLVVCFACSL